MGPTAFPQLKDDIALSLKKGYTKKVWLNHALSLQEIPKKTFNAKSLIKIMEERIPYTKRLQDSIIENKAKYSLWSILNKEINQMNSILAKLEEKEELSRGLLKLFNELTEWAYIEETAINTVL